MTTAQTQNHQGPLDRNHFLLRRLHSLTGVVPIGVFLLFHPTTNASVVWGMLDRRGGEALPRRGGGLPPVFFPPPGGGGGSLPLW